MLDVACLPTCCCTVNDNCGVIKMQKFEHSVFRFPTPRCCEGLWLSFQHSPFLNACGSRLWFSYFKPCWQRPFSALDSSVAGVDTRRQCWPTSDRHTPHPGPRSPSVMRHAIILHHIRLLGLLSCKYVFFSHMQAWLYFIKTIHSLWCG